MKRFGVILFAIAMLFCLVSCDSVMGYGVLLWSLPEYNLSDATVVPVYVKSNISKTYIIGIPDTKEKIEVPLWQITDPQKKSKAEKRAQRYKDYQHVYARVFLDGLPMRQDAVNTSKQVYRLRKDEVIKVLYKTNGQAVMSGSNAMKGEWLRVLASDGTSGWCFSYNLRLFDETEQVVATTETVVEEDTLFTALSSNLWYPENYATMIKRKQVDLSRMVAKPAFRLDLENNTIHFDQNDIVVDAEYTTHKKSSGNVYKFDGTTLSVTVRNENFIVVQYSDERGMPTSFNLVTLASPIEDILSAEAERRVQLFNILRSFGAYCKSTNYGTITFTGNNGFTWENYNRLVPSLISRGSGETGTVSFDHFLHSSLGSSYDGAITFTFDATGTSYLFLYKIEDGGIRLESANKAVVRDNVITQRGNDSLVLYFAFEGEGYSFEPDDSAEEVEE